MATLILATAMLNLPVYVPPKQALNIAFPEYLQVIASNPIFPLLVVSSALFYCLSRLMAKYEQPLLPNSR